MKAIVHHKYGAPGGIELQDGDQPPLTDDGVLVRVRASSVNPAEWHAVTGTPYLARPAMGLRSPRQSLLGADFAGTVEAVGSTVTRLRLQPGAAVFGGTSSGAFVLQELLAAGKITPVIDRQYPLSELPEALRYLGEGHAQGKVVISV